MPKDYTRIEPRNQHSGLADAELTRLRESEARLREALRKRAEWLRKEAYSGGSWDHLIARSDECLYLADHLAHLTALEGKPPLPTEPQPKAQVCDVIVEERAKQLVALSLPG